ncbi:MAG: hypothetical protein D6723_08545 [Acidobacteria bacterium]|nr:MAG: hypothetical protein D6723_08545 [Acidobacteriota bacterium]
MMKLLKIIVGIIAAYVIIKIALWVLGVVFGLVVSLVYVALAVGIVAFVIYFIYRVLSSEQHKAA